MKEYPAESFGKVAVLMGGVSEEREISLQSGQNILAALQRNGVDAHGLDVQEGAIGKILAMKPDRAFIALHGAGGEDGSIQGVLEYLKIPYTGSGVAGSAISMNKIYAKLIWQEVGVPTSVFRVATDLETAVEVMMDLGLPLCVKPSTSGSSVGVSKVTDSGQLPEAFAKAAVYGVEVMMEPWIEGAEYTIGILGQQALPVIEIQTTRDFYDFEAKYTKDSHKYVSPDDLTAEQTLYLQELAMRAFRTIGCIDWGRADLMMDVDGNPWFLEINSIPGMTTQSLFPAAADKLGISFDALVLEILSYTTLR